MMCVCFCGFPPSWCCGLVTLLESCSVCAAGLCSLVPAWQPFAAVWGIPAHPTWLWDAIAFCTREAEGEGGCWKDKLPKAQHGGVLGVGTVVGCCAGRAAVPTHPQGWSHTLLQPSDVSHQAAAVAPPSQTLLVLVS